MKLSSSTPFSFLAILSLLIMGESGLHAGASNKSGNPFGNGSFFPTSGTFTGVLRGTDLVGVTQFSTSTNASLTGGTVVIYNAAAGMYNDGMGVYATLNPSANTLTALILPSVNTPPGGATPGTSTNIYLGGGSFSASLSTTPPNQTYSGSGVISQVVNTTDSSVPPTVPPLNQTFSITGCRISSQ